MLLQNLAKAKYLSRKVPVTCSSVAANEGWHPEEFPRFLTGAMTRTLDKV